MAMDLKVRDLKAKDLRALDLKVLDLEAKESMDLMAKGKVILEKEDQVPMATVQRVKAPMALDLRANSLDRLVNNHMDLLLGNKAKVKGKAKAKAKVKAKVKVEAQIKVNVKDRWVPEVNKKEKVLLAISMDLMTTKSSLTDQNCGTGQKENQREKTQEWAAPSILKRKHGMSQCLSTQVQEERLVKLELQVLLDKIREVSRCFLVQLTCSHPLEALVSIQSSPLVVHRI